MDEALNAARAALAGRSCMAGRRRDPRSRCWDARRADVDVVVDGDPAEAARAIAGAAGRAACFALSEEFGAWRVLRARLLMAGRRRAAARRCAGGRSARCAISRVNAIAEPIAGGEPIDPLGGLTDLAARRLRMASPSAFAEDPLRVLRLARIAVELDLEPEPETTRQAREQAAGAARVLA